MTLRKTGPPWGPRRQRGGVPGRYWTQPGGDTATRGPARRAPGSPRRLRGTAAPGRTRPRGARSSGAGSRTRVPLPGRGRVSLRLRGRGARHCPEPLPRRGGAGTPGDRSRSGTPGQRGPGHFRADRPVPSQSPSPSASPSRSPSRSRVPVPHLPPGARGRCPLPAPLPTCGAYPALPVRQWRMPPPAPFSRLMSARPGAARYRPLPGRVRRAGAGAAPPPHPEQPRPAPPGGPAGRGLRPGPGRGTVVVGDRGVVVGAEGLCGDEAAVVAGGHGGFGGDRVAVVAG